MRSDLVDVCREDDLSSRRASCWTERRIPSAYAIPHVAALFRHVGRPVFVENREQPYPFRYIPHALLLHSKFELLICLAEVGVQFVVRKGRDEHLM